MIEMHDLFCLSRQQLLDRANTLGIRSRTEGSLRQIVVDQVEFHLSRGDQVTAQGILEISGHQAYLAWEKFNFQSGVDAIGIPQAWMRDFHLRPGLKLEVLLRLPRDRNQHLGVSQLLSIEGIPAEEWEAPKIFDKLTPLFPKERMMLEAVLEGKQSALAPRVVDLIAPLGRGQRGLIVAPPRVGKTLFLRDLALAIQKNYPDTHLMLLLIDERPEEVTDFCRTLECDIFSSTFDESPQRHVQVAELVSERAKRLVELQVHVVILLDSITRLSRAYNSLQSDSGRTLSGGVDSQALVQPKKFFGAARNVEEGGSLTILATALIETQSRMDDLIFEEYKGTGNMEIHLDRTLADLRIFPAVHMTQSATRKDEFLYHPDEYERVLQLRKQLTSLPAAEAMKLLHDNLLQTDSNTELLLRGLRGG